MMSVAMIRAYRNVGQAAFSNRNNDAGHDFFELVYASSANRKSHRRLKSRLIGRLNKLTLRCCN